MKKLLILLFILIPTISFSQFKFPSDANFKYSYWDNRNKFEIKPIIENSITFEFRLWVKTFTEEPVLLRLTYNNDCIWKAEKYLVNESKVFKTEIIFPDNWNEIWDSLVANNILTLPHNPPIKHHEIAKEGEIPYVEVAITDGTSYTVELLSRESSRKYSMDNPVGYFRFYADSKPLKDFNKVLEILSVVYKYKFN